MEDEGSVVIGHIGSKSCITYSFDLKGKCLYLAETGRRSHECSDLGFAHRGLDHEVFGWDVVFGKYLLKIGNHRGHSCLAF